MIGEGIRCIAALFAAVLVASGLIACGDSNSTTTSAPAKEAQSDPNKENGAGTTGSQDGGSRSPQQGRESSGAPGSVDTVPLKVSGGGAEQYRNEGGDNSIQEFGEEGEESDLEEAATVLHDYLVARAEGDWPAACNDLAGTVMDQLKVLASRSDELEGQGCAKILRGLAPPLPAAARRESTIVDAGSLRIEDNRAFLLYRGPREAEYALLMEQEKGVWKVASLSPTPTS